MASRFKDVTDERSYGIKRRHRKPKYAKEQRVFENWCDENVLSSWIRYSSGFLPACVNKTEPTTIVSVICYP